MNNANRNTRNFTSTSLSERHDIDHNNQKQKNCQAKHRCCISLNICHQDQSIILAFSIARRWRGFCCVCIAFLFQCPRVYIDPTRGTYVPSQNQCPLLYSPTNTLIYQLDGIISSHAPINMWASKTIIHKNLDIQVVIIIQ
jgi:hypothetical protein